MISKNPNTKFAVQLVLFSLALLTIGIISFLTYLEQYYLSVFPYIFGFFIAFSYLLHYYLLRAIKKKPNKFVRNFLAITGLKFLVYIVIIVIFLLTNKENSVKFLLFFFILYLLFTVFEIRSLLGMIKNQKG